MTGCFRGSDSGVCAALCDVRRCVACKNNRPIVLLGGHVAQQDTRASISDAHYQIQNCAVHNVHVKLSRTPADVSFSNSPSNPEEPVSNKPSLYHRSLQPKRISPQDNTLTPPQPERIVPPPAGPAGQSEANNNNIITTNRIQRQKTYLSAFPLGSLPFQGHFNALSFV